MDRNDDSGDVQFIGQLPRQVSKGNLFNATSASQPIKSSTPITATVSNRPASASSPSGAPMIQKRGLIIKSRPKTKHVEGETVSASLKISTEQPPAAKFTDKVATEPSPAAKPAAKSVTQEPLVVKLADKTATVESPAAKLVEKKEHTPSVKDIKHNDISHSSVIEPTTSPSVKRMANPLTPFSWQKYLKLKPASVAPKEAFNHSIQPLVHQFKVGMKLVAQDPRNRPDTWCLASIILMEGPRLKLRFEGGDSTNDFYELVDSRNIKPYKHHELLSPPLAFKGDVASYPKFVEKTLLKDGVQVAPPEIFLPSPTPPNRNLFKAGMKLEAVDMKNPYLICPGTVRSVDGQDLNISLDGWSDGYSFNSPKEWETMILNEGSPPQVKQSKATNIKSTPEITKELHLSKVQLQPRSSIQQSDSFRSPGEPMQMSKNVTKQNDKNLTKSPNMSPRPLSTMSRKNEAKRKRPASPEFDFSSEVKPKKQAQHPRPSPRAEPATSVNHNGHDGSLNQEEPSVQTVGFQCQRTIPYDEWLKTKNQSSPKPAVDSSQPASSIVDHIHYSINGLESPAETAKRGTVEASKAPEAVSTSRSQVTGNGFSSPWSARAPNLSKVLPNSDPSISTSDDASTSSSRTQEAIVSPDPGKRQRGRPPKRAKTDSADSLTSRFPPGSYENWNIKDIVDIINLDPTIAKYSDRFEEHEIDGQAFVKLDTTSMVNVMNLKLGPVLKVNHLIELVKEHRR